MIFFTKIFIITCCMCLAASSLPAQELGEQIERLAPPKAAPPPGTRSDLDRQADEDLRKKQMHRGERDKSLLPPEEPFSVHRNRKLLQEAIAPHNRSLMFELSLHLTSTSVRADRKSYATDPSVHFNIFYRYQKKKYLDKTGPWFGLRMAPFSGSGFHKNKFGSYGLTYLGPMIGVGKIGLIPLREEGEVRSDASLDTKIPSISGWLIGTGIAAVSKSGRSTDNNPAGDSDFNSKGIGFDGPGLWFEARYIKILYGALGYNLIIGVQSGKQKEFFYTGIGISGWD